MELIEEMRAAIDASLGQLMHPAHHLLDFVVLAYLISEHDIDDT